MSARVIFESHAIGRRLDFAPLLLGPAGVDVRLGSALNLALRFMRKTPPLALADEYLGGATAQVLRIVEDAVLCIDHTGLLCPAAASVDVLGEVAREHGFVDDHQSFPSVIVARELTALNEGRQVPTRIFRATAPGVGPLDPAYGIEVFVPEVGPAVLSRWIGGGVGTHAAFRVNQRSDVDRICHELRAAGFHTPGFMDGHPMTNVNDGTRTVYFDLDGPDTAFRLEFFHRAGR